MTYWIDYGTLLGAVWDSGVIPWDLDVDVGVLDSELEEHWESIRKDLGDRYGKLLSSSETSAVQQ